MLQTKQAAPYFRSYQQDGQLVTLSDYLGDKNVILYFYPKDDTPGCTVEAQQFTALAEAFDKLNTVVLGVSKDDCGSHRAFMAKYGLTVQLLADTGGNLCETYGVWREKEKDGVKKMAIL